MLLKTNKTWTNCTASEGAFLTKMHRFCSFRDDWRVFLQSSRRIAGQTSLPLSSGRCIEETPAVACQSTKHVRSSQRSHRRARGCGRAGADYRRFISFKSNGLFLARNTRGGAKMKDSFTMLLKRHVEKMSVYWLLAILLKTNGLLGISGDVIKNKGC